MVTFNQKEEMALDKPLSYDVISEHLRLKDTNEVKDVKQSETNASKKYLHIKNLDKSLETIVPH